MNQKAISIGIESYKEIVDRPYYYVDKTLLIKDLLDNGTLVSCFTRPRRFGKTLALSMLKTFFELEMDSKGNVIDNSHYFEGMKIAEAGECYMNQQGKYPVISLSLKSAKQPDFDMAYQCMIQDIAYEYDRHRYVLLGEALSDADKAIYTSIMERKGEKAQYATSLKFLAECLKKYHGRNVVILIDEYDVPLENAYFRGFYNQMIDFVRSLFESALKTNDSLEFAVITGCLRISRESIFTGLNNLEVISVLNENYSEYYGFTESEVKEMLRTYGLEEKLQEVKQWYDGYLFGNTEVYNPWSVLNQTKEWFDDKDILAMPWWANTSSNNIIRTLIGQADDETKEIETSNETTETNGEATSEFVAPVTGNVIPVNQVKDEAFASEAMGKGVGIEPENGKVYAPFDGNVDAVFPTGHLVGLSDGNGAEVLIHIGVDTVKLEGKGFTTYVSQGDKVKKGDLLVEFDVELLKKEGYDTTVMFITTDTSKDVQVLSGRKEAVKDIAFLTV